MKTIPVNGVTYWLPENNNDVIALVNDAKEANEIICVRGAAHSFPLIGTLETNSTGRNYKYVMLSEMNAVTHIDNKSMTVTVQAGCHLGVDPFEPTGNSNLQNSLLWQLDQQGMAVADLGGITHQTVGGFLSTGSSGGSTQFAFEDALMSIDVVICGNNGAEVVTYTRPNPDNPNDPFHAVGLASIGLMGIMVSATFKCIPNFNITGTETISTVKDCEIDLFGPGSDTKPSFQNFLEQTQYTRIIWWPQQFVTKSVVWKASQIPYDPNNIKQYQEVPWVDGSPIPATLGADVLYSAMGQWPDWLAAMLGSDNQTYKDIVKWVTPAFVPIIFPLICSVFVTPGVQDFHDIWYNGLPMDNQMGDKIMPVWFTELWIPIDQSEAVMKELLQFYNSGTGCENTGIFCVEIYAAKKSSFWMSPAYNTDVIRIDVFWFANSNGDPTVYYQKFWTLLQKYSFRPHWGKYLPDGNSLQGVSYLQSVYPKWNDWMNQRAQNDPNQIFVNDYWRSHLGIPNPSNSNS